MAFLPRFLCPSGGAINASYFLHFPSHNKLHNSGFRSFAGVYVSTRTWPGPGPIPARSGWHRQIKNKKQKLLHTYAGTLCRLRGRYWGENAINWSYPTEQRCCFCFFFFYGHSLQGTWKRYSIPISLFSPSSRSPPHNRISQRFVICSGRNGRQFLASRQFFVLDRWPKESHKQRILNNFQINQWLRNYSQQMP